MARATIDKPTCNDVLNACNKALEAKKEQLRLCDAGIKIYHDENQALGKENAALREEGSAWYRNPWLLILLGVAAGVVVAK